MDDEARRSWEERTGEFSPTYYAHKGSDGTSETLRELLAARVGRDAAVLELGCNVGRHLAHLREDGFTDLTGIDINPAALAKLRETNPALAAAGAFQVADVTDALAELPTDAFDAVYSVESFQHVASPDGSVFDDAARVTDDLLVTVENEGAEPGESTVDSASGEIPIYYRDWHRVFTSRGLQAVAVADEGRDTLRAFQPS